MKTVTVDNKLGTLIDYKMEQLTKVDFAAIPV